MNEFIQYTMEGVNKLFSVGQSVYDNDWNIMGWPGIGLFPSLNYDIKDVRVPVSYWKMKEKQMTNKVDKEMKEVSDTLTITFDSSLDDEAGICVSRVVDGKVVVLKMELGEQADILYHLLTE